MNQDTDTQIWHAIYDSTVDAEEGKALADKALVLIHQGRMYDTSMVKERRRERRRRWWREWCGLVWTCGVFLTAGPLIGWGINGWVNSGDNDYAGYGPNTVNGHGYDAIHDWFGQAQDDHRLTLVSKEHSTVTGIAAWKLDYKDSDGKLVCAFVWYKHYQVEQGSDCLTGGKQ